MELQISSYITGTFWTPFSKDAGGKSAHFSRVLKRIIYFPQEKKNQECICKYHFQINPFYSNSHVWMREMLCSTQSTAFVSAKCRMTASKWSLLHSTLPFLGWQHNKIRYFSQICLFCHYFIYWHVRLHRFPHLFCFLRILEPDEWIYFCQTLPASFSLHSSKGHHEINMNYELTI